MKYSPRLKGRALERQLLTYLAPHPVHTTSASTGLRSASQKLHLRIWAYPYWLFMGGGLGGGVYPTAVATLQAGASSLSSYPPTLIALLYSNRGASVLMVELNLSC